MKEPLSSSTLTSSFTFIRFNCTLDTFFTFDFINFFISNPFLVKSIQPFSDLTSFSLTIDLQSELLLTLSRSLDQSSGLDASKPLVDSAVFDSSTRLIRFDLKELASQKNRLERIQKNSKAALSRPEYSCEFISILDSSKSAETTKMFERLGIKVKVDESLRPRVNEISLNNFNWFGEINFNDSNNLHDLFNWIGSSFKSKNYPTDSESKMQNCKHYSIEAPLIPFKFISNLLTSISSTSGHLIVSLKVCQRIPPSFELNSQRLKQFNERKFDVTACTADQRAFVVFTTPQETISFQLNGTS